jgi:uncharacterized membrane protein
VLVLAFGGTDTFIYRLFFFLHIVSIVVAFVPAVAHPLLYAESKRPGGPTRRQVAAFIMNNDRKLYAPALIAAGLFGILLVVSSDDQWKFSQGWVSAAFIVWIAMNAVLHAMMVPAERQLAQGNDSAERKANLGANLLSLLFLIMLYLMIWKPGA